MWKETTERRYNDMFNYMMPAAILDPPEIFLVGEPTDHDPKLRPRYAAFAKINRRGQNTFSSRTLL